MKAPFRPSKQQVGAAVGEIAQKTEQTTRAQFQLAAQVGSFFQMGFRARVWWLLTGDFDQSLAVRNAQAVADAQAATQPKGTD